MNLERLAPFRKKPTLKQRNAYRPTSIYASVEEAKEIIKKRYKIRGFLVIRVTRQDWHFSACFGEDAQGFGKGPAGLPSITCNWPYINDSVNCMEAEKFVQLQAIKDKKREERIANEQKRYKKIRRKK